jgi:hypothetical protein
MRRLLDALSLRKGRRLRRVEPVMSFNGQFPEPLVKPEGCWNDRGHGKL